MEDNSLHIGETERIAWIEFDISDRDWFEVDYILTNYRDFWNLLEVYCVAGCCGLDAFRFYPEDITKAVSYADPNQLKKDLTQLKQNVLNSGKQVITSSVLNNSMHTTVFIQLLDHIIANLER